MAASTSDLTATGRINTNNSLKTTCLFLDRLPLEIREMVYRRLLFQELNMKSAAYDENRGTILKGPDHWYDLNPAILDINRQIKEEVMNLFQREIILVSLSSVVPAGVYSVGDKLSECGVPLISCYHETNACPAIGMTIEIDAADEPVEDASGSFRDREVCLFMIEDLPAACNFLQSRVDDLDGPSSIRITVNRRIEADLDTAESNCSLPKSKVSEYLDPLWRIHSVDRVEVDGPVHPTYKAATIASMCGRRLKANEFMRIIGAQFDEGDKASHEGRLWSAIAAYKAALLTLRGSSFNADENDEKLVGGRFHGHSAGRARASTEVRLHSLIADAYLRCGRYRMARIYVERIYGPLYSMDDRANHQKLPLEIPPDSQVAPETYAELLHVAARISLIHGKDGEANDELAEASDLDPSNTTITQLMEQVVERRKARWRRRQSQEEYRTNCATKKSEAALSIVTNRMVKGDEAFDKQDFTRARKYYEAANGKAHQIGYVSIGPWDTADLRPKTLIKLITVYLELDDHDKVHHYADMILDFNSGNWWSFQDVYRGDSIGYTYTRGAFYTAYYSKAFVFQKHGDFRAALKYFENAWRCDDECEATYYQLQALRQIVGTEDEEQKTE